MSRGLCNFEAYSKRDIKLIGDICEKDIEVYGTIKRVQILLKNKY